MNRHIQYSKPVAWSAAALAAAVVVAACGGGGDDAASEPAAGPPAPAAPAAPTQAQIAAARVHYFGAENVDATTGAIRTDLVVVSWATNTTFVAAINGRVVLMDAALLRRETTPGRTPTTLNELVQLMPSFILIGKSAEGHADLASDIAFRSGATVVGAAEHCDALEADARRQLSYTGSAKILKCQALVPAGQAIGQTVNALSVPDLNACLRAVKHSDANAAAADPTLPAASFDWSQSSDTRDTTLFPVGTAATDGVRTTAPASSPSVLYHLSLGAGRSFGMVWHDRSGSLKENAPAAATLMRSLPKTDVHVGSVDVSNASTNGLRDPALYVQAIQPKVFFPAGHDAAAQRAGAYNTAELMKRALEAAIDSVGVVAKPELRVNFDPYDYVKPHYMTFDPAASGWQQAGDRAASTACN